MSTIDAPVLILPSSTWLRRALAFSSVLLLIALIGGYFVPWVLLLVPVFGYRALHAFTALRPGKLSIELYPDRLVCRAPFQKPRVLKKSEVKRFATVYRGTTELSVARMDDASDLGESGQLLYRSTDIPLPQALRRCSEVVGRLEAWRQAG